MSKAGKVIKQAAVAAWKYNLVRVILAIIIGLLVIVAVVKIRRWLRSPANADYIQGGGSIQGFDPKPYADAMYEVIDGIGTLASTKAEAAQLLYPLNDNQLIAVHNYWVKDPKMKKMGSLWKAMDDEWNVPAITWGTDYWALLKKNLERLHLDKAD